MLFLRSIFNTSKSRYCIIIFLFVFLFQNIQAQTYKVSLLTCSPGDEIYSVFGHSALRVQNVDYDSDVIFNFGMFDFNTSHFALKFAFKKLEYCLATQQLEPFLRGYTQEGRTVVEQELNLTEEQKRNLVDRLNYLYLPENRYYLYAFLERNCSTEIRDLFKEIGIPFETKAIKMTNRQLLESYLGNNRWLRFGINLTLGLSIDRKNDSYRSMFLPDYLHDEVASVETEDGKLVTKENILNQVEPLKKSHVGFFISPLFLFSFLAVLLFFWSPKPVIVIIFSLIGLIGIVLVALMGFSGHVEVKNNLNILWCNPLYLIYIPFLLTNKYVKVWSKFFLIMLGASIIVWIFSIQQFDWGAIPLLFILILLNIRMLTSKSSFFSKYNSTKTTLDT